MKKIIFISIAILSFSVSSVKSQTVLPVNSYIYSYAGISADTVSSISTTWNKAIQLNKLDGLFYNISVKVADVIVGAKCSVAIQGKYFASDSYTTITSVTWYGGGTDTTILFTQNSNKIYYRYLNFLVVRVASKAKVDKINVSIKK